MKPDRERLADIQAARARELMRAINSEDQRRIAAGKLRGSDLFFISREMARASRVSWNFGRRREAIK